MEARNPNNTLTATDSLFDLLMTSNDLLWPMPTSNDLKIENAITMLLANHSKARTLRQYSCCNKSSVTSFNDL